jgi:hypothetical protein
VTRLDDVLRVLVDHVHVGGDAAGADVIAQWRDEYDDVNAPSDDTQSDDKPDDKKDVKSTPSGPVTKTTPGHK